MITPLYTEQTECQDCYKCVRACPVKAICISDGHAQIEQHRCTVCGNCVRSCPSGAQKVRNDIPRAKQLLSIKKAVYISLAPSFPTEFGINWQEKLQKLLNCGFAGISETALGADIVSEKQKELLENGEKFIISTACPTLVETVQRYYPSLNQYLSPLLSPMLTHGYLLKKIYGEDIGVLFVGPCIAKKSEADYFPELIDVALTFDELDELLQQLEEKEAKEPFQFVPQEAQKGRLYPLDGGMVETLQKEKAGVLTQGFIHLSGMNLLQKALEELSEKPVKEPLFCEFLTCEGGCINGSGRKNETSILQKMQKMSSFCHTSSQEITPLPKLQKEELMWKSHVSIPVAQKCYCSTEIERAFEQLEKSDPLDQLDCGGCGYNSCEEFATAWLNDLAEPQMCVTTMRKTAQKKVKALIQTIPMGVAIVNRDHEIMQCNTRFIDLFLGDDFQDYETVISRLQGLELQRFVSVDTLIDEVTALKDSVERILHHEQRVIKVVLFPIEEKAITGILFQDITTPSMKRDTVIKKAEEVIEKSLKSVQQIASLLGENAAETEIILNSLIDAFGPSQGDS